MHRPIEVVIVATIVGLVGLAALMAIPRQREASRTFQCRENLRRIGVGLALGARSGGHLPAVPDLGGLDHPKTPGPIAALLGDLGRADLVGLDTSKKEALTPGPPPEGRVVAGFLCPSDPIATSIRFPATISYRATAGDRTTGENGAFAPGRIVTTGLVASADGLEYTAAFSERLVGDGKPGSPSPRDYAVAGSGLDSCGSGASADRRGDAGRSWAEADWRSTLYNHAIPPNAKSSCIAADGKSARIGASSGHGGSVHVLTLDGAVRAVGSRVDPKIWKALAAIDEAPTSKKPGAPNGTEPRSEPK